MTKSFSALCPDYSILIASFEVFKILIRGRQRRKVRRSVTAEHLQSYENDTIPSVRILLSLKFYA